MIVTAKSRSWLLSTCIASLATSVALGKEFAVHSVTNLGGQPIASSAVPLAVVGNRLVLSATEDNQPRIYSTDGSSIQTINQTVAIASDFNLPGGAELARLGDSVYFPGFETPGTIGLYATDGTSVRKLGGVLSSVPHNFRLVNGNLVFEGTSSQLYGTDGTTLRELAIAKSLFANTVLFNHRLLFAGYPVGGGSVLAYSTDGQSLAPIVTTGGKPLPGPQLFADFDGSAYFVAGGLMSPAIYRTSDGLVGEKVAAFEDFTFTNVAENMFALHGSLYVQIPRILSNEWVFYKSNGGLPTEILTVPVPTGVFPSSANGNPPLYVDEHRAYFQVGLGSSKQLYAFDGTSFDPVDLGETFVNIEFSQFGDRTFLNGRGAFESLELYELIDGNVVHIGPGLDSMTLFQGELFGVNARLPNLFDPKTLYHTVNDQLAPLGDFGRGEFGANSRFVDFNGKLYFSGQGSGVQQPQLFAVVEVPEPVIALILATSVFGFSLTLRRRRQAAEFGEERDVE